MRTALLVIDIQSFFYDMYNPAHDPKHHERQFIPKIAKLIRGSGEGSTSSSSNLSSTIVVKNLHDAFINIDLALAI